jgi:hypothetical protein
LSWGTAKTDSGTQAAGAIPTTTRDLCIGARPHISDNTLATFLTGEVYDVIIRENGVIEFEWRGRVDYAESGSFLASSGQTVTISGAVLQGYQVPNTALDIVNVTINATVVEVVNVTVNPSGIQTVTVSVDDAGTNTEDIAALAVRMTTAEADVTTQTDRLSCRLYRTTTQSIPNTAVTNVLWTAEEYDVGGLHSTSVNTDRITIPTGGGGLWCIGWSLMYTSGTTGVRTGFLAKNGGTSHRIAQIECPASASTYTGIHSATILRLVDGDYLALVAYQTQGSAVNIDGNADPLIATSSLWAYRLGD